MKEFICPMHPEIKSNKPGNCPKCAMRLVKNDSMESKKIDIANSYTPLVIIILLILITSIAISFSSGFIFSKFIFNFMIGFFLVFSGFKLMDLKGFANGYSTYDLLAKRIFSYGYVYPFIELFFALAMIANFQIKAVFFAEIIIMAFSGLGVAIKLSKQEKFQCACLGTFLKVPLTKVTLVEDFGMTLLAILMLVFK